MEKPKIYPSSLYFSIGEYNPADNDSQCWRYAQLSRGARKPAIHPDYAKAGALHESWYERTCAEGADREVPFKVELDGAVVSGRADFVFPDRIVECKASFDKRRVKDAASGKPKTPHLAQLVCYMLQFGISKGQLVYGYWDIETLETATEPDSVAIVDVSIVDGAVLVNGAETGYRAEYVSNSITQLEKWLTTDLPAPRPSTSSSWMSPCKYCPLKTVCDRIDTESSIEPFKSECRTLIENHKGPEPKRKVKK